MMQCPVCAETQLVLAERQGIEIDYCPRCRGVWLDRGELDKVIERSASMVSQVPDGGAYPHDRSRQDYYEAEHDYRGRRKRRGFLDDLFDFD